MKARHVIITNALVAMLFAKSAFAERDSRSSPPQEAINTGAVLPKTMPANSAVVTIIDSTAYVSATN